MLRIKPNKITSDKEKVYEESTHMKLLVNKYKTEIEQMRVKLRQLDHDFIRQNELLLECTEKTENPSYKKIHNYCLLSRDLRGMESQLEDANAEIERLKKKSGEDRLPGILKELEVFKAKNSDLNVMNEELKRHQERYLQEINDLEVKNQEFASIIEENNKEISKIKELTSRNHDHKSEISKLKEDMVSLSERNQDSEAKIKELSKQNYEKTSEIAKLKKELEDLSASSQAQLADKAKVIDELWADISDLEEKHIASEDKILEFQKEIHHQKSETEKLLKDLETKASCAQREEISKAKLIEELRQNIKNLEDINKSEHEKTEVANKKTLEAKSEYDKTINDLNLIIKTLQISNSTLENSSHSNYHHTILQNLHLSTIPLFLIRPVPLITDELKQEYLSHIFFSLQLSRIDKSKLSSVLFGSGHNPENSISPPELSVKFKNPPFLFIQKYPSMVGKISEFLVQASASNKKSTAQIKQISQTLDKLLPDWRILTENEEEALDRELSRIVCLNAYEIQCACKTYDKQDTGVIAVAEFNSAMESIKLTLSDRAKGYCSLLFYSVEYEIDKAPYKNFIQAYGTNSGKLLAEDIEYIVATFFMKIAEKMKEIKKSTIITIFALKNKLISMDEFKSGAKKLGIYILQDVIQLIFKYFKYEKDGKPVIQYKEFKKMLKKCQSESKSKGSSSSSNKESSKSSKKNNNHKVEEKKSEQKHVKPVEKEKALKKESSSEEDSYYTSSDQQSRISYLSKGHSSNEVDSSFSSKVNNSKIKNNKTDKSISEEDSYSSSSEQESKKNSIVKQIPEVKIEKIGILKNSETEERLKIKDTAPTVSQKASRRYSDASSKEEVEEKQELVTKIPEKSTTTPKITKDNISETKNDSSKIHKNPPKASELTALNKEAINNIPEKQLLQKDLLPDMLNTLNPPTKEHGFVVTSESTPSYNMPSPHFNLPTDLKIPSTLPGEKQHPKSIENAVSSVIPQISSRKPPTFRQSSQQDLDSYSSADEKISIGESKHPIDGHEYFKKSKDLPGDIKTPVLGSKSVSPIEPKEISEHEGASGSESSSGEFYSDSKISVTSDNSASRENSDQSSLLMIKNSPIVDYDIFKKT